MLTLNDLKELLKELNKSANFNSITRVVFYSDGSGRFEMEGGRGLIAKFRDVAKLHFKTAQTPLSKIEGFDD